MKACYPSYVDFDDSSISRPCDRSTASSPSKSEIISTEEASFFLNQHRLESDAPYEPGDT